MKIKTSELTGPALRWAVATLEGYTNLRRGVFSGELVMDPPRKEYGAVEFSSICYGTDWAQGGPIIERERIAVSCTPEEWCAYSNGGEHPIGLTRKRGFRYTGKAVGPAPLIAAMRCYVASKLGDEVEVPEGLA